MKRERHFRDPKQFLEAVLGFATHPDTWAPRGRYIFRGQSNSGWPLVPKAFRAYADGKEPIPTASAQAAKEFYSAMDFFETADAHGLAIPGDSYDLRQLFELRGVNPIGWPDRELFGLIGLGQHYGLPTRLLDWSRSALVAAYFAAKEASIWMRAPTEQCKRPNGAARLCVWALDTSEFKESTRTHNYDVIRELPFWLVATPSHSNPNLAAQMGCFTLYQPKLENFGDEPLDVRSLDVVYRSKMVCLTLPIERAPQVLWLLDRKYHTSAASIFPGYAGIVSALEERDRLQFPLPDPKIEVLRAEPPPLQAVVKPRSKGSLP